MFIKTPPTTESLFGDYEFRKNLERLVANAVYEALRRRLPAKVVEVEWICRAHAVNCRFDVSCCGQDCNDSRLNFVTNGQRDVIGVSIG